MDIQFRCTNVSSFDEAKGAYEKCNQLLQVSDDNVGLKVRCPRCNQMAVVPGKTQGRGTGGSREARERDESVAQVEASLSYGKFSRRTRCPKCGSVLDEQKNCTACRYQTPKVKSSKTPLKHIEVQPAGFQLWFRNIMSDGVGSKMFEVAMHSFCFLVVLGLILFSIIMGGTASIVVILIALGLAGFYALLVVQTKRLATVPVARLPFYLKPLWYSLLVMARSQNWEKYDSRLKDRIKIDVRGQAFSDRELLDLDQLTVCQVLDAEGTDITDNALVAMYGLKHLRCLVIRKTHVTHEGVFRLQQALPKCWIWY